MVVFLLILILLAALGVLGLALKIAAALVLGLMIAVATVMLAGYLAIRRQLRKAQELGGGARYPATRQGATTVEIGRPRRDDPQIDERY
jgi:hypothetical protein